MAWKSWKFFQNFTRRMYILSVSQRKFGRRLTWPEKIAPITAFGLTFASCESPNFSVNDDHFSHDFLIQQACTANVNAASQLLTVTVVAIEDTSKRLRESLIREICLVRQAVAWGDSTPQEHWDELIAIRSTLEDLKHNLTVLSSFMEYAEKLATTAAEISYLSGNKVASDVICERIQQAQKISKQEAAAYQELQVESLKLQKTCIINSSKSEKTQVGQNGSCNDKVEPDKPKIE